MTTEFDIIKEYFDQPCGGVKLGIGDDAAVISGKDGVDMVLTTDTLVSGTHFSIEDDPFKIGQKCVAVNLSDLSAMGSTPRYLLLSLTLPVFEKEWVKKFSDGIKSYLHKFSVGLIGGDTTRGDSLSITITAIGEVAKGKGIQRDLAKPGDDVWVSGLIGLAAVGLLSKNGLFDLDSNVRNDCLERLHSPEPRVLLGERLLDLANSAIDISDGLISDAGHIAARSKVQVEIDMFRIPIHQSLDHRRLEPDVQRCILSGGDDYELLFSAPKGSAKRLLTISNDLRLPLTNIGRIVKGSGVTVLDQNRNTVEPNCKGYDHFGK